MNQSINPKCHYLFFLFYLKKRLVSMLTKLLQQMTKRNQCIKIDVYKCSYKVFVISVRENCSRTIHINKSTKPNGRNPHPVRVFSIHISSLSLLRQGCRKPIKTFIQSISSGCTTGLNIPLTIRRTKSM